MTDDEAGPVISARSGPDPIGDALRGWRPAQGCSRMIVEVDAGIATAAEKRARRRRVPLGRVVEDALRLALGAEGAAVAIAALLVGTTGCGEQAKPDPAGVVSLAQALQWSYSLGVRDGQASKLERVGCGRLMLAGE